METNAANLGEIMNALQVLALVVGGGAIGGLSDFVNRFKLENSKVCFQGSPVNISQIISLGIINAILGIGGALSVLFIVIIAKKFESDATAVNQLFLLSVSVVSGFGGRRFLNLISSKLEDQIGEAYNASKEAQKDAREAKESAVEGSTLSTAIAVVNRENSSTIERVEAIGVLQKELNKYPTNRKYVIILGRLHKANRDYKHAIEALSQFLNAKGDVRDDDYADVLYNRACYEVLKSRRLTPEVIEDLGESFKIDPSNIKYALEDNDFAEVRDEEKFVELTATQP